MDDRAAKLALARKKLKDHQEKKLVNVQKDDNGYKSEGFTGLDNSKLSDEKDDEALITQSLHNSHDDVPETMKTVSLTSTTPSNINTYNSAVVTEEIPETDINITEILIANKRNLELQVYDLQTKLGQLEKEHEFVVSNYKLCNQKIHDLQNELQNINEKYLNATKEILIKDSKINELNSVKLSLSEENSNLSEQIEFTKTVLNAKESENDSLHNQLYNLQNQYDVMHLQLQQLTNGSLNNPRSENTHNNEKSEVLLQKISSLEQQLSLLQKERDQINLHYEHYVAELTDQLKSVIKKNEELTREVENLSNRENSLIEQISDMEIRIQNYNIHKNTFTEAVEVDHNSSSSRELQFELNKVQEELSTLQRKHEELQNQYAESVAEVKKLSEVKEAECNHDNICLSKLNADMTSDKVAAQRATEQNKKLKQDLQRLEDAFVKMSKDKLELTEKITAEKYLNRELTIKLSEAEEKAKDMQVKLKAKDEEMIRIQSNLRNLEEKCVKLNNIERHGNTVTPDVVEQNSEINNDDLDNNFKTERQPLVEAVDDKSSASLIQRDDAMLKLQERFLKIMGEVADLSDEKHRLEHIILQLQNETDTICEYVALYQQQRSLLKRRDEERSAQLKIFQQECGKLKCELEELTGILARFAEDKQLSSYFQMESKRIDMENVMTLLNNLKNNSLIDPKKQDVEFKNFYPCNCCSGKLIEV